MFHSIFPFIILLVIVTCVMQFVLNKWKEKQRIKNINDAIDIVLGEKFL